MCGRYTIRELRLLVDVLGLPLPAFEEFTERPRFNVAPSQLIPIVVNEEGTPTVRGATWGFVPFWAKDDPRSLKPINAKCETVATGRMFRDAFKRRRCLIPADGFYEWQGVKPPKRPYFIHMKDDSPFAFAGIREGNTCAIITTTPNAVLETIHNRMPVIIGPADFNRWLNPAAELGDVSDLLKPYGAEAMEAYPVSTQVNNTRNDGPELVERAE